MSSKRRNRASHNRALDIPDAPRLREHSKAAACDNRPSKISAAAQPQAQQPDGRSMAPQQHPDSMTLAAQPQYLLTMYAAFDGDGDAAAGTSGVFNGTVTRVTGACGGPAQHQLPAALLGAPPKQPADAETRQELASDAAGSASVAAEDSNSVPAGGGEAGDGKRQGTRMHAPVVWRRNPTARSTQESSFYSVASRSGSGDDRSHANRTSKTGSSRSGGYGDSRESDSSVASERHEPDGSRDGVTAGREPGSGGSRVSEADGVPRHLLDVDDAADAAVLADQYR